MSTRMLTYIGFSQSIVIDYVKLMDMFDKG